MRETRDDDATTPPDAADSDGRAYPFPDPWSGDYAEHEGARWWPRDRCPVDALDSGSLPWRSWDDYLQDIAEEGCEADRRVLDRGP